MRYALVTEPQQGYSYADILDAALAAESAGIETFFRTDHYTSFPRTAGLPTTDAWTTLAGLARDTTTIGLGSMVSPVTFRVPGVFAKIVATVDEMSDGRVEMGSVGAGTSRIIPRSASRTQDPAGRVDRMEEQLEIMRGLWDEPDGWSFEGEHYQVRDTHFRPRDRRPHLIIGGVGRPRSIRLAATYADEYNIASSFPAQVRDVNERLDAACEKRGRDPSTLTRSVMTGVLVARDEAELARRTTAQKAIFADDEKAATEWLDERRGRWVIGAPDQAAERIAEFQATGVDRLFLQCFLPRDTEHITIISEIIAAQTE